MAKTGTFEDLSLAPPSGHVELWRWLYGELRTAIIDGRLKPGARVPSSRGLAVQYGLSRGTVVAAFDQLRAEGYLDGQTGSGTFVAAALPDDAFAAVPYRVLPALPPSTAGISKRARALLDGVHVLPASRATGRAFRPFEPAIDLFPVELWSRVAGRVLRRAPRVLYGQGSAAGYLPLRKAIAEYIGSARGVRCNADQIVITSGAQQALHLVARVLIDPGDRVVVEDPCYPGALWTLRAAGARIVPLPVDRGGLRVDGTRKPRLIYVTPANQFPLGVTLAPERRIALLEWASRAGAFIIEDEYDAEYRYFGQPVAALQNLDRSGCVLYTGTFTKMLFNALRLGFVVLPERLVDPFIAARTLIDRHPPALDQAILAEFILEGHFGHHVRHMRQIYAERKTILRESARQRLAGILEVEDAQAGMRTVGWLKQGSGIEAVKRARALGLELAAVSEFTLRHPQPEGLILGFASCDPRELRRGVRVLESALMADARSRVV